MKNRHSIPIKLVFILALLVGGMGTGFSQKVVTEPQIKQAVKRLDELSLRLKEKERAVTSKFRGLNGKLKDQKPHQTSQSTLSKDSEKLTEELMQLNTLDCFLGATLQNIARRHSHKCEYKVSMNTIEQKLAFAELKIALAHTKQKNQVLTKENTQLQTQNNRLKLYLFLGLGFNMLLAILLYFRKFTRKILWKIRVRD
ncbi:MAG TPA: hypothetical protein DCS93_00315 [Microscillaceae bacterium]|nr:hypothetical protein [Microscillaceae bacterium]